LIKRRSQPPEIADNHQSVCFGSKALASLVLPASHIFGFVLQ
jgi:hypothetical protein